jgi:hypothetical protein
MAYRDNIKLSEYDGKFVITRMGGSFGSFDIDGGSLGLGTGMEITAFGSEEARQIYIIYMEWREQASASIARLSSELQYLKTVKGANENLRKVRAERKAAK